MSKNPKGREEVSCICDACNRTFKTKKGSSMFKVQLCPRCYELNKKEVPHIPYDRVVFYN